MTEYPINTTDLGFVTMTSTNVTENTGSYAEHKEMMRHLYHVTLGITVFTISIIGILTNILNIIALTQIIRKSRLPVYRCFLGLAVADFLVMFCFAFKSGTYYLKLPDIIIDRISLQAKFKESASFNYIVLLLPHFTNVALAASNWCVVVMSLLRFIAIYAPLWYQSHCTPKVVNAIIVSVYVFSLIINIPSIIGTSYDKETKRFVEINRKDSLGFNPKVLTLFVQMMLPVVITTILLILLIWKLCSSPRIERSASNAQYRSRDKLQSSITLVCISTFFVLCILPDVIYYCIKYLNRSTTSGGLKQSTRNMRFSAALQILLALNYAANFFFYVLLNDGNGEQSFTFAWAPRLRTKRNESGKSTVEVQKFRRRVIAKRPLSVATIKTQVSASDLLANNNPDNKDKNSLPMSRNEREPLLQHAENKEDNSSLTSLSDNRRKSTTHINENNNIKYHPSTDDLMTEHSRSSKEMNTNIPIATIDTMHDLEDLCNSSL